MVFKIKSIKKIGKKQVYDLQVADNNNFILGNSILSKNSGKSQTLKNLGERAFLRGIKVVDLYGGPEEGFYWALKSNHPFWNNNREFNYKRRVLKAMEFPVKCLIPMSKSIPFELPDFCQTFTIPINSLTEEDLKALLGNTMTKNEAPLWRKVKEKINKKTTMHDLINYIIDAQKGGERTPGIHGMAVSSIYNTFNSFVPHKLLSSAVNPLALNIKEELRNKKVITSLILKYFPREYRGFIINYFIHTIYDLMESGTIKHPVVILFREFADYLVSYGESSPQELAIKKNIIETLRHGRKHQLHMWMDTQNPINVDIVKTECEIKICHKVDNTVELENALGDLGAMLLTKDDYYTLMKFRRGQAFILQQSPIGLFKPTILPPLSRMTGDEGADFIETWRNEKGNRFKNIRAESQAIIDEYKDSEIWWDEEIARRKNDIREKKKIAKTLEEMEKEKAMLSKKKERDETKLSKNKKEIIIEQKDEVKDDIKGETKEEIDEPFDASDI